MASRQPTGSQVAGGCRTSGAAAKLLSFSETSTDRRLEEFLFYGSVYLGNHFDVEVEIVFFDDSDQPNAFATPESIVGQRGGDGTVLLGRNLVGAETRGQDPWRSALLVITAHELAHISQYKKGLEADTALVELHADYLAGWCAGREDRRVVGGYVAVEASADALFARGSFAFNNPDFHGTPRQRVSSFREGYKDGKRLLGLDEAFEQGSELVRSLSA